MVFERFKKQHHNLLHQEINKTLEQAQCIPEVLASTILSFVLEQIAYLKDCEIKWTPVVSVINYNDLYTSAIVKLLAEQDDAFGVCIIDPMYMHDQLFSMSDIIIDLSENDPNWVEKYVNAKETAMIIAPFEPEIIAMQIINVISHSFIAYTNNEVMSIYKTELLYYAVNKILEENHHG